MAIKIVTDSASDILPKEAEALGVTVIPLTLLWDGEEYKDAVDMDHESFFTKLEGSESIPTTSQIPPVRFSEVFEELCADGDQVVVITLSSGLSGTFQSANIAASDYEDQVYVVDSLSATVGQRLMVEQALAYRDQGMSAKDMAAKLEEDSHRVRILAKLDTLKYLKKGGRISAAAAFAGEVLSVKPVIIVKEGVIELMGKARGSKNANNLLRKLIGEIGGINTAYPCRLVYSGLSRKLLDQYINDSQDMLNDLPAEPPVSTLGAVIGTHIGPGAIGIAFFENN